MYHVDDMPAKFFQKFPQSATQFRNVVESNLHPGIRPPLPPPGAGGYTFKPLPPILQDADMGLLPTLLELSPEEEIEELAALQSSTTIDTKNGDEASLHFKGGETAGLARIQEYFFDCDCLKSYFSTRNGMLGQNYSSKFSPWLAAGCISARTVAAEVKRYESERVKSKETYWMLFELIFRDYFRYYVKFHGSKVFKLWGPKGVKQSTRGGDRWLIDLQLFDKWRCGRTGNPMIDANMRELASTGFMSNRGRQIVASFLTRDMNLDWRLGAMYFESMLIDHDVCLNWGNWTYAAGVGSDPREDRYFSIPKQTQNYDPDHRYIKYYCEEVRLLPAEQLNRKLKTGVKPPKQQSSSGSGGKLNKNGGGEGRSLKAGGASAEKQSNSNTGNGSVKSTNKNFKKYTRIKV